MKTPGDHWRLSGWSRSVVLVLFYLISGAAASAQEREPSLPADSAVVEAQPDSTKNPTSAMVRSLLLPGWGQFYNRKWFKGILIAGAEIGLIANAIVLNQWANEAATEEEFLYYIDNRNLSFWLLGATILYSMADAYVDAHLFRFDESPQLTLFLQPEKLSGSQSTTLMMRLTFSIK